MRSAGVKGANVKKLGTAASARGGNAIVMAQMQAIQLVTSGLWGLAYYREIRGRAMYLWGACAVWTIVAIVLLVFALTCSDAAASSSSTSPSPPAAGESLL